jgi:hypothetical protein
MIFKPRLDVVKVFAKNAATENDGSQQRVSAGTSGKHNGLNNP